MGKTLGGLFVLWMVIGVAGPLRADDQADCRATIVKAIKAIGGEEKVAKYSAETWKETGTYHGMGMPLPYKGIYAVQWPGQFRMEIEGVFTVVLNNDQGWIKSQNGTVEMTKEQLAEQKEGHYVGWVTTLLPLKDPAFQLSPLGESKVGNQLAVGVKVSRKDRREVRLYFDKDSGLLLKSESRPKDEMSGKEVDQEDTYHEYKDFGGVKKPTKISIKRDGKIYVEAEIAEPKSEEKLDEKVFEKP